MSDQPPRPKYHDYQPPRLYQAGCTLRRSYLTGRADSVEEGMMQSLLRRFDEKAGTARSGTPNADPRFFFDPEEPAAKGFFLDPEGRRR